MNEDTFFCRSCGVQYKIDDAYAWRWGNPRAMCNYFKKPHYCHNCGVNHFIFHLGNPLLFDYCIDCGKSVDRKIVTTKNGLVYLKAPGYRCENCQTEYTKKRERKCVVCQTPLIGHSYKYCPNHRIIINTSRKASARKPKVEVFEDLHWPFSKIYSDKLPDYMIIVNNAVPMGLPSNIRDDVCQDIIADYLSGGISLNEIADIAKQYVKKQYGIDRPYRHVSLDSPVPGYDDLRIADTISNDTFHF